MKQINSQLIYPKVLIVNSQSVKATNATGITLRSIWKEWSKESLLELFEDDRLAKNNEIDIQSIKMPDKCFPIKKILMNRVGAKINSSLKMSAAVSTKESSLKSIIRQTCVYLADLSPAIYDKKVLRQIQEYDPDVIYTLGGSVIALKMAYKIAKMINKPIVLHFMDNWVESLQADKSLISGIYRKQMLRYLKKCLRYSSIGITISDSMAKAYNKLFSIDFSVLMNSVKIESQRIAVSPARNDNQTHFVYAGGLHLNRWKALQELANCISEYNGRLIVYTGESHTRQYKESFDGLPVEFRGLVNHDKISEVYESADVLVHAETQNPSMLGFFRYSISTKIPEYLASGKRVLFYGPSEMGLYHYLQDNGVAYCASDIDELKVCIETITRGTSDYDMQKRAFELVANNHDIHKAHEILKNTMVDACCKTIRKI